MKNMFSAISYYVFDDKLANGYKGFMERYPILFRDRSKPMNETCMCWGIECPHGWYNILEALCNFLEYQNIEVAKYGISIVADQVKEKFGTLRFYYHISDDGCSVPGINEGMKDVVKGYLENLVDGAISDAEDLTASTCADCGRRLDEENTVETKGWITYICKSCDEKRQAKYKELAEKSKNS